MNQTRKTVVGVLSLVMGLSMAAAASAQEASPADVALAERFFTLSQRVMPSPATQPTAEAPYQYQQCAAMLKAAAKLDPAEPRFPRLLADALLQVGDEPGAIEAMKAYRKLRPGDQGAQLELINLYMEQIETLQGRIKYLKDLSERESVPKEVRSAVAERGAELLYEKGDEGQTLAWLDQALSLNPLNGRALEMKYRLTKAKATPGQRLSMVLGLLRANPTQYAVVAEAAWQMSMQGMVSQSILWYSQADRLAILAQMPVPYEVGLNYASELVLANKSTEAATILDQMIAGNPADYIALVLRAVAEKHTGKPNDQALGKLKTQAWNALVRQVIVAGGDKPADPTTRPADEDRLPAPDITAAVQKAQSGKAGPKLRLRQAVEELAWFAVYMDGQTDAAKKLMDQLAPLVEPSDAIAMRIAGWIYLLQEKKDEARVKLSAAANAADKDALAALGLVRLMDNPQQAKAEGQKLLERQPAGVLGALLWDGLADAKLECRIMPSADAGGLIDALEKFPKEWLEIDSNPQKFYQVRGEPLKVVHRYGEPIIGRITLQNLSDYDITIGVDGTIQPVALIEVQPQGWIRQQVGPARIFERVNEQLVLRPRQSVIVKTRLDQQELSQSLDNNPVPAITLTGNVRTNTLDNGIPGPAGMAAVFGKPIERGAFPVTPQALEKLGTEVAQADNKDRLSAMDLAVRLAAGMVSSPQEAERQLGKMLADKVRLNRSSPDGSVRAWALCLSALLEKGQEQSRAVHAMAEDKDWRAQLLSLVAMQELPGEEKQALLEQVQKQATEPLVREFAKAGLNVGNARLGTTRPAAATQPGPAAGAK
jgi:tetratricopeptide (TPR) repeat protein